MNKNLPAEVPKEKELSPIERLQRAVNLAVPGTMIVQDLPDSEYRASVALGSTIVAKAGKHSPAEAFAPRKASRSQTNGKALHCLLLEEDDFLNRFFPIPEVNWRTKEGKEQARGFYRQSTGEEYPHDKVLKDEWFAAMETAGMTMLTTEDAETVAAMAKSVRKTLEDTEAPHAPLWLTEGQTEVSLFGSRLGFYVKGRLDLIFQHGPLGVVVDFKSTHSLAEFESSYGRYGYAAQAEEYLFLGRKAYGHLEEFRYFLVVVESTGSHGCAVYEVDKDELEHGQAINENGLDALRQSLNGGELMGVSSHVRKIRTAPWQKRKDLAPLWQPEETGGETCIPL